MGISWCDYYKNAGSHVWSTPDPSWYFHPEQQKESDALPDEDPDWNMDAD